MSVYMKALLRNSYPAEVFVSIKKKKKNKGPEPKGKGTNSGLWLTLRK